LLASDDRHHLSYAKYAMHVADEHHPQMHEACVVRGLRSLCEDLLLLVRRELLVDAVNRHDPSRVSIPLSLLVHRRTLEVHVALSV
jgi:hypothetical protein